MLLTLTSKLFRHVSRSLSLPNKVAALVEGLKSFDVAGSHTAIDSSNKDGQYQPQHHSRQNVILTVLYVIV